MRRCPSSSFITLPFPTSPSSARRRLDFNLRRRSGSVSSVLPLSTPFCGSQVVRIHICTKAEESAQKQKKPFKGMWLEHMNGDCPVIPSQLTSSNLRCNQFHTDIFCLRERDLLNRLVEEISLYQNQGRSKDYALALLAGELGRAFAYKAVLLTFIEVGSNSPAAPTKDVLGLLRSLYALTILDEDPSFLQYGYLSKENIETVRREVLKLCSEVRPHTLALV